jgi:hypothetical protein
MGIFNKLTDAIKDAAPVIGGVVGFGLGGPGGSAALYAALGSGIGGLVAGQDINEAMRTAAIGGALGYGAGKMFPSAQGFLRAGQAVTAAPTAAGASATTIPGVPAGMTDPSVIAADVASAQQSGSGIMGALSNLSTGQKVALGAAGLGSLALLGQTEEEEQGERRPFPKGEMFDITARSRETGDVYQLTDPEDLADYRREISDFNYYHGGEVEGPGTGTSDSVPARLSDGEFVMTAKAVRGAGGGDRDIGAARMYDMMAELEAQA